MMNISIANMTAQGWRFQGREHLDVSLNMDCYHIHGYVSRFTNQIA